MLDYFSYTDSLSKKTTQSWEIIINSKRIKKKISWDIPQSGLIMSDLELYFEVKFFLALLKCVLRNVVLWYLYKVVRC